MFYCSFILKGAAVFPMPEATKVAVVLPPMLGAGEGMSGGSLVPTMGEEGVVVGPSMPILGDEIGEELISGLGGEVGEELGGAGPSVPSPGGVGEKDGLGGEKELSESMLDGYRECLESGVQSALGGSGGGVGEEVVSVEIPGGRLLPRGPVNVLRVGEPFVGAGGEECTVTMVVHGSEDTLHIMGALEKCGVVVVSKEVVSKGVE